MLHHIIQKFKTHTHNTQTHAFEEQGKEIEFSLHEEMNIL